MAQVNDMKLVKTLSTLGLALVVGLAALFTLCYVLTSGNYTVAKTVAEDPSLPHITINGVTFHAQTFGDPAHPVVIVVHGGPGGDYRSLLTLQALSDRYFVVFLISAAQGCPHASTRTTSRWRPPSETWMRSWTIMGMAGRSTWSGTRGARC
jgi:hypothetical protein